MVSRVKSSSVNTRELNRRDDIDEETFKKFQTYARKQLDAKWDHIINAGDGSVHCGIYQIDLRYSRKKELLGVDDLDGYDFWQR